MISQETSRKVALRRRVSVFSFSERGVMVWLAAAFPLSEINIYRGALQTRWRKCDDGTKKCV